MAKRAQDQVIQSSGNVFADIGLPDAAELDTKARLCAALNLIVERQRLTHRRKSRPRSASTSRRSLPYSITSWKAFPSSG